MEADDEEGEAYCEKYLSADGKRNAVDDANDDVSKKIKRSTVCHETHGEMNDIILNQQQLDLIGCDEHEKLKAFQKELDDAVEKLMQLYVTLKAKVAQGLEALGKPQVAGATLDIASKSPPPQINTIESDTDVLIPDYNPMAQPMSMDSNVASFKDSNDASDLSLKIILPPHIQAQINKAKQQLADFPNSHPSIEAALDQGRVIPHFHALALPKTFLNHRRNLSQVTAGDLDETRSFKFAHFGENFAEFVVQDETGKERAAGSIVDSGVRSTWRFSSRQTDFAVELVNREADMLGEGVECTRLTSIPMPINSCDTDVLLTRPESRGVVANVFHRFQKDIDVGSVSTITGSEGIGKSWTLFYALQQALLYDGTTVLFFFEKSYDATMFHRRNNKLYAWTTSCHEWAGSCLFNRRDVLVLLDPREANDKGAHFSRGAMKLLYVAYNNNNLISSSAEKENGNMQAYLGPPLDGEMRVIAAHLEPSLDQVVVKERSKHVGNLIRYVLRENQFNVRVQGTEHAESCASEPNVVYEALWANGMTGGHRSFPETMMHVLPMRPTDLMTMGYDGQGVQYRKSVILAATDKIRNAIINTGRDAVLRYWSKVDGDEYAIMAKVAERLFIEDLSNPDGMVMKRYFQSSKKTKEKWDESELVVSGSIHEKSVVRLSDECPVVVVDAASPERVVYHVTVSSGESMTLADMESLCKEAGYIDEDGNVVTGKAIEKMELYWVVPERLLELWQKKGRFRYATDVTDKRKVNINKWLDLYVDQYILPMMNNQPPTISQWKSKLGLGTW